MKAEERDEDRGAAARATRTGEAAGDRRERRDVVVVGAGPAGLAAGAMIRRDRDVLLLEASARIGDSWRRHYDRLRLHTVRWLSGLPDMPIPRGFGKWVPRDRVVEYLERYARANRLPVRLDTPVERIDREGSGWLIRTPRGVIEADHVVIATGFNRDPHLPAWPGRDGFTGELIHSSRYRNAEPYRGKRVLVVGTGNSGAEIAVDLVEGDAAEVFISVRTPPNIQRRDIRGFPTQLLGVAMRRLPRSFVDAASLRVQRLVIGDLTPYGIPRPTKGSATRIQVENAVPILDIGLVDLLKRGRVRAVAAVESLDGEDVVLADGSRLGVDAVIAATGFLRGLAPLVGHLGILDAAGRPVVHGARTHPDAPNLYLIGFSNPISGNLREIAIDARRIGRAIRERSRSRRAA